MVDNLDFSTDVVKKILTTFTSVQTLQTRIHGNPTTKVELQEAIFFLLTDISPAWQENRRFGTRGKVQRCQLVSNLEPVVPDKLEFLVHALKGASEAFQGFEVHLSEYFMVQDKVKSM